VSSIFGASAGTASRATAAGVTMTTDDEFNINDLLWFIVQAFIALLFLFGLVKTVKWMWFF
jgi:hypothetical protein